MDVGDDQAVFVADFVEQQLGRFGVAEVAEHVDVRDTCGSGCGRIVAGVSPAAAL